VIDCERPGFIKSSQYGLLANYCIFEDMSNTQDLEPGDRIKVSHEMTSITRSLRLTNQSRYTPETAARKADGGGRRPWELNAG
jgi:hypothetical protein